MAGHGILNTSKLFDSWVWNLQRLSELLADGEAFPFKPSYSSRSIYGVAAVLQAYQRSRPDRVLFGPERYSSSRHKILDPPLMIFCDLLY